MSLWGQLGAHLGFMPGIAGDGWGSGDCYLRHTPQVHVFIVRSPEAIACISCVSCYA